MPELGNTRGQGQTVTVTGSNPILSQAVAIILPPAAQPRIEVTHQHQLVSLIKPVSQKSMQAGNRVVLQCAIVV
jgi:hypothetical protein